MSTAADRYSDYLHGVPLNTELAGVREGRVELIHQAPFPPAQLPADTEVALKALTRKDRILLRELYQAEGWPVLMRVLGIKLEEIRKRAITNSQHDPLENAANIAKDWAYVTIFERAVESLVGTVRNELETLSHEELAEREVRK